jgi:prepilin peptidase CpaA
MAQIFILAVFPALLMAAAGWDIVSYTIPNFLQLLLLAGFAGFVFAAGLSPAAVGFHLVAGFAGLALGFALFAFGLIGGGDAKLFACVALWLGFNDLLEYALMASIFGGLLTLCLLSLRRLPLPQALASRSWIMRLHDERGGIPYGVALAAGAFFILPHTEIFRVAAAV